MKVTKDQIDKFFKEIQGELGGEWVERIDDEYDIEGLTLAQLEALKHSMLAYARELESRYL